MKEEEIEKMLYDYEFHYNIYRGEKRKVAMYHRDNRHSYYNDFENSGAIVGESIEDGTMIVTGKLIII